nr:uncharacterized protein LOC127335097 [Lolium perenne]
MIDLTVRCKKNHHKVWTSYQDTFRRLKHALMACSGHNGGSDGDGMVDEGAAAGYTHMRARRGEAIDRHKHCTYDKRRTCARTTKLFVLCQRHMCHNQFWDLHTETSIKNSRFWELHRKTSSKSTLFYW